MCYKSFMDLFWPEGPSVDFILFPVSPFESLISFAFLEEGKHSSNNCTRKYLWEREFWDTNYYDRHLSSIMNPTGVNILPLP